MESIYRNDKPVFKASISESASDSNRLYSILLDTKASAMSENMYDIAEKIFSNEKDNSKFALDQLWALKKNLQSEEEISTIDMLISFYQDKIDILRNKEEHIKKISKDSRELLSEKRKRDSEIANVRQDIEDCTSEIDRLEKKLHELNVKEQELFLIDIQLEKELKLNANEVVNGLYEIVFSGQDLTGSNFRFDGEIDKKSEVAKADVDDKGEDATVEYDHDKSEFAGDIVIKKVKRPNFPKSVVKTTKGKIIGEFYYHKNAEKNNRVYVYNSIFLYSKLNSLVNVLSSVFDKEVYAESLQIIQDLYKRVSQNEHINFEVSTNEILNLKSLKNIWTLLNNREYSGVKKFCSKLGAKIIALGDNYAVMLAEQMERYRSAASDE